MRLVPVRYLPPNLSAADKKKQIQMLKKSRQMYTNKKYYNRKPLSSYRNKTSKHIRHAEKIYGVDKIIPSPVLVRKTGCSMDALNQIVSKGEGAYYSSGSRPNQTAQSWGFARLASALTSGKAAAVDYNILEKGCAHNKRAFILAKRAREKYGYGQSKTQKVVV
jgi:hypothetical protein